MRVSDAIIAGLFLAAAYGLGAGYAHAARQSNRLPDAPALNRRVFGAALMSACGRGMTTPAVPVVASADTPANQRALIDFLGARRDAIACGEIPAGVPVDGLDGVQRASRYLVLIAATTWALTGPAWSGIDHLLGLLFGLSIALAYLIGRLAMGRVAAALVAVLYMISPRHLANLLDLRDYSKTTFFAASLLIVGLIVIRRRPAAAVLAGAAAAGAVLGFGFGVRTDIALNLPMVIAAVIGFLPAPVADTWKLRLLGAVVCVAAFIAVASPILGSGESASNVWHLALLGYSHASDEALDVAPAPYEPGYFYSDSYVATVVDAYWGRTTGSAAQVSVGVPAYSLASRRYYTLLLTTFPADALLRGWAAVIQVLELPYGGVQPIPGGLVPEVVGRAIAVVQRGLARCAGLGLVLFAVVVLAVSARSFRLATLMFGIVAYLGAYPAIQFQPRHLFHLELLSLWLLGFAASSVVARIGQPRLQSGPWMWRPLIFAAGVVAVVLLPLTTLRAYQQRTASALLATYDDARKDPVPLSAEPLRIRGLARGRRSMHSEMLAVEVSAAGCPADRLPMTFRYRTGNADVDFSRTYNVEVPADGQITRVYFPIYETGETSPDPGLLAFGGLEIADSERPCVKAVSRFAEPDRFPLLLAAILPAAWRDLPLHQTLRGWERRPAAESVVPVSYWAPIDLRDRRAIILSRFKTARPGVNAAIDYQSPSVRVDFASNVTADGTSDSAGSYLVAWKAIPFVAGSVLVAEGRLERGGLTIGLVDSTGWVTKADVNAPGAFRVVLQAPRPGPYQVVVANHLLERSLRNRFAIARIAVVDAE